MRKRLFVLCIALSPLAAFAACSGDDSSTDAGPDAGKDVTTTDVAKDSSKDATLDVTTKDVTPDVAADVVQDATQDVTQDAPAEASQDAAPDAAVDASDANTTDASTTDASDAGASDAMADAADGGSSWHTPTCDGTISTGEYGDTGNQTTNGTQTWYVTWDATNLYVALDNATLSEADVVYVGFSGNGYQTAQVYDSTGGTLPFLADGVVYAKSGYEETRIASNSAWGTAVTNTVTFCSSGSTREEVIPWTALGATSIPSAFRFLAYATSNVGFVYGQIPTSNPGGSIGTSATFGHDFYVTSTANGTGSFPFDLTE